jgi:hypothetical protein
MKPVGADFGGLGVAASFMSRSMSRARSNEATYGWYALEREGREKGRRPAPHAGVMLAQHLVRIEFLRSRQHLCFGDGGAEALPRDHRRDRIKARSNGTLRFHA